jgi:hypothetical protein
MATAREDLTSQIQEALVSAQIQLPDTTRTHPLRPEEQIAAVAWLQSKAPSTVGHFEQRAGPFRDSPLLLNYFMVYLLWRSHEPMDEMLGAALLPRLVSAFEQFLAGLIRTGLTLYPEGLGEFKPVPPEIANRYASIEDIKRYMIDEKVADSLEGGPYDWAKRIKKWPGLDLQDYGRSWLRICEAVQRRHVVIHNDGQVDADYLKHLPLLGDVPSIGSRLKCSSHYMSETLISFRYVAIGLTVQWGWKLAKVPPMTTHPSLVHEIVESFEKRQLWQEAQRLADIALSMTFDDPEQYDILRVNRWLSIQEQGHGAETIPEIEDWRPEQPRMKLAKAALLRNYPQCIESMKVMLTGPGRNQWQRFMRQWPLIRRAMREDEKIGRMMGDPGSRRRTSKSSKRRR